MKYNQPEFMFKLPELTVDKTLGRYEHKHNWVTNDPDFYIYIDIKRIIKYCTACIKNGWDIGFDQVFSHIVSHEYIHYILETQIGGIENNAFDNLFGVLPYDPEYVYSGVKFKGDLPYILPKRHFYTKLINSIRNKIGIEKNATE